MYLDHMLEQLSYTTVQGDSHIEITELVNDSRKVVKGCVFVCISGAVSDGHDYINEVVEREQSPSLLRKRLLHRKELL